MWLVKIILAVSVSKTDNYKFMNESQKKIVDILCKKGKSLLNKHNKRENFTGDHEADNLLNNIERYPHAYVIACLMDMQIPAERAWIIPYKISEYIGGFEFDRLVKLDLDQIERIFKIKSLHRFNKKMAERVYRAIKKIDEIYSGDASNIWKNKPGSATIVRRFLEFEGAGIKISTMAANILARCFKIPMKDYINIDISPDVHVKRVLGRLGFISKDTGENEIIYCAREINPQYPGILDGPCWEIGTNWCKPHNPKCDDCYLNKYCPKVM